MTSLRYKKWNIKIVIRAGRGITLEKPKGVYFTAEFVQVIGIAVDRSRRDKSVEAQQEYNHFLKEYHSTLSQQFCENRKLRKGEAIEGD